MTKYILHGGRTRIDNENNRTFFAELARGVPDGGTILMVYFVYDNDPLSQFEQQKKWILESSPEKELNIVFADRDNFIDELRACDAVYFHGGDTAELLKIVSGVPEFEKILEGKTVAGSSAGAYVFSSCFIPSKTGLMQSGLGTLPIKLLCHYNSPDFDAREETKNRLEEECSSELELVVLGDSEWRIFET